MNSRIGSMLRSELFPRDHAGVDRNMRTIRFALEGALITLVTVAAFSQFFGIASHGMLDIVAAVVGAAVVLVVRVFRLFGA